MSFYNYFLPYLEERNGKLEEYLKKRLENHADNLFQGFYHYQLLKEKNLLIPNTSLIRVNSSPVPDICYLVDSHFQLEGQQGTDDNMSLHFAQEGQYDPKIILENKLWSVSYLNL